MTRSCTPDLLAGAALDALSDDDVARQERHLESCAACQAELGALRDAVTCLALSVPQLPPHTKVLVRILSQAINEARVRPPIAV